MLSNFIFLGTVGDDVINVAFKPILGGNDILAGNDGNDFLQGFGGKDQIYGQVGNDFLDGGTGDDSVFGGVGEDIINGGGGNDLIEGGADNDTVFGASGDDLIYGDNAAPIPPSPSAPFFEEGDDFIDAGSGNDTVFGQGGNDSILGAAGDDSLVGDAGDDTIGGGPGNDTIFGGDGNDFLRGWTGDDVISGGAGDDHILSGAGSDVLTGGAGADVFIFRPDTDFRDLNVDTITDFDVNNDKIDLRAFDLDITYDVFEFALTEGNQSVFFQAGSDVIIASRPVLPFGIGSLGTSNPGNPLGIGLDPDTREIVQGVVLEDVNIDDLGQANFML